VVWLTTRFCIQLNERGTGRLNGQLLIEGAGAWAAANDRVEGTAGGQPRVPVAPEFGQPEAMSDPATRDLKVVC
jgi:hypothetical protein